MTQPSNNITTLLISDPNGGQPQMFKVMGGPKIPLQLASPSGASVGASAIKNFIKTAGANEQGATIIQAGIQNRQIITVPAKQGMRGPVVVPVSNVQLKSTRNEQIAGIIGGRSAPTVISSPMVICTQAGSLGVGSSPGSASLQTPIQLPQINVAKQIQPAGTSNRQTSFTLKTTQVQQAPKQSDIIFFQQNQTQDSLNPQQPSFQIQQQSQTQQQQQQQQQQQMQQQQMQQQMQQQQKQRISQAQMSQKQQSSQLHAVNSPKSLMNTSILDHSGSRKRHDFDFDYSVESKRRKTEKGGKGLRHFSMKVCEKVQAKGTTSYNEVADELVNEFSDTSRSNSPSDGANYDQKNIRRRVYDALNVLMAMNIISKEKKEIRWLGLPTNSVQECYKLELERKRRIQKIKLKTQQLQDLILQQIAFKNLVERNRKLETDLGPPSPNSAIQLPFIIVNTSKKTVIDCSISNDKTEYLFNFDDTFEIHDDIEVLKRMGMALGLDKGMCTPSDQERAKALVPKALESYVTELAEGRTCDSTLEAKGILPDDLSSVGLDDFDSALNNLSPGEFSFEKVGSANGFPSRAPSEGKAGSISRHSSLLSLSQDQRTESASPSSFGEEYDAENFDESDVEIG